jgi:hypothetical protein
VYVTTLNLDSTTGDIQDGTLTTKLVSSDGSGNGGNGNSALPLVSKDGSRVAFVSTSTNLSGENGNGQLLLFSYNVASGVLSQVSPLIMPHEFGDFDTLSVSDNGSLAYVLHGAAPSSGDDLFVWNASTGQNTQNVFDSGPYAFSHLGQTSISGDGSTVVFTSAATNLVANVSVPSTSTTNVYGFSLTPAPKNISTSVKVTRGVFHYSFAPHEFLEMVTVTNTSGAALKRPLALVLTNLSSNAKLHNASGTYNGSPYIELSGANDSLADGASITVTLAFDDPTYNPITYGTQVWQNV